MFISFFEEFPTKDNLNRLKLVNFPTKLYLAAKSLEEFDKIKSKISKDKNNKNVKEFIYWPILEIKEGYWISPFSQRKALSRILSELKGKKMPVMLDLELPTTKNPLLYLTQTFNFFNNKRLINDFIKDYEYKIYLAEYYPEGKRKEKILQFLGLHYSHKKAKIIKMVYHSLHHFDKNFIIDELKTGKKEFADNYLVSYGTIAKGINSNEPILDYSQLEEDLKIAQQIGIKEIIIFRLGGLNQKYIKIINKYNQTFLNSYPSLPSPIS